jgi:hypothetical protein
MRPAFAFEQGVGRDGCPHFNFARRNGIVIRQAENVANAFERGVIGGENFGELQFAGGRAAEAVRERAAAVDPELPTGCWMREGEIIEVSK